MFELFNDDVLLCIVDRLDEDDIYFLAATCTRLYYTILSHRTCLKTSWTECLSSPPRFNWMIAEQYQRPWINLAHRGKRLLNDIYNGTASGGFIETTKYLIEKHQDIDVKVLASNKGCKKTFELFPDIDNDEDYVWSKMRFYLGGEYIDQSNNHRSMLRHALASGKYNYVQEMISYYMARDPKYIKKVKDCIDDLIRTDCVDLYKLFISHIPDFNFGLAVHHHMKCINLESFEIFKFLEERYNDDFPKSLPYVEVTFSCMFNRDDVNMCEWYVNKYNIRKWKCSKVVVWLVDRFNIDKNQFDPSLCLQSCFADDVTTTLHNLSIIQQSLHFTYTDVEVFIVSQLIPSINNPPIIGWFISTFNLADNLGEVHKRKILISLHNSSLKDIIDIYNLLNIIHDGADEDITGMLVHAVREGRMDVCVWLRNTFNITKENVLSYFQYDSFLEQGQLRTVKWLFKVYKLGRLPIGYQTIEELCKKGHFKLVKWVLHKYGINPKIFCSSSCRWFKATISNGWLDMAKWLHKRYQLTSEYVQRSYNKIIVETATNGQVESCRWLVETFKIDISAISNEYDREIVEATLNGNDKRKHGIWNIEKYL